MFNKLRTPEPSTLRRMGYAAALTGALVLTACSGDSDAPPPPPAVEADATTENGITYYNDGTRSYIRELRVPEYAEWANYTEACKPGYDIIETTVIFNTTATSLGSVTVMPANGKCADGILTPEDFSSVRQPAPSAS